MFHSIVTHTLTFLTKLLFFLHEIIICCMTHQCIGICLFMTGSSAWLSSASGSSSNVPTIISAQSSGTESNQSISALDTPKIGQHYQCSMNRIWQSGVVLSHYILVNEKITPHYTEVYTMMCIYVIMHTMIDRTSHLSYHLIITSLMFAAEMGPSRISSEYLTGWKYALQSLNLLDVHASKLSLNKIYLGTPMVCIWG